MSTAHKSPDTRGWIRVAGFMAIIGLALGGMMVASVSPAAAASASDIEVVFTDNATDPSESGPLPDEYGRALIIVENTTLDGTLNTSEVTFSPSNGATVSKEDPFGATVEGYIDPTDIPDSGTIDVEVSVSGSVVDTVTISKETANSSSMSVNTTDLANADSVNITFDSNESQGSYGIGMLNETYNHLVVSNDVNPGIPPVEYESGQGEITIDATTTHHWSDYSSDLDSRSTTETSLYFSDAVSEIEIDGETIYSETSDVPLGSSGGTGTDPQTIGIAVIGGAAALILLSD